VAGWNVGPVRIGILGAARVAEYAMIAPARSEPSAELAGIAARDPGRARAYADRHGIPCVHESYAALMSDPGIDLVYVATPPAFHAELALRALEAGKHVLVEKPFSMSADEAAEVAGAARAKDLCVAEAMHSRHHPLFSRLAEILRSGILGDIKSVSGVFLAAIPRNPDEFRWKRDLGGGALMDLGVYPLAWLRDLLGGEPEVVNAHAEIVGDVDASIEAELRFPSDIVGHVRAAMNAERFVASLTVDGAQGSLTVTNPLVPQLGHEIRYGRDNKWRTESVPGPTTFAAQLAAVCATVRGKRAFPLGADDFVRSMAAIDAVRSKSTNESS
jgi:predicted dehydrogenase